MAIFKYKTSENWYFDFTINGHRYRGTTKTAERSKAAAIEAKLRSQILDQSYLGLLPDMTIDQAYGRYYQEHGQYTRTKGKDALYQSAHIARILGADTMLADIDDRAVAHYVSKRRCETHGKNAKPISNSTVNRELTGLRSVLRMAANKWKINTQEIHWPQHMLPEPHPRESWITDAQARELIKHARPHLKPIIQFALLTGVRFGNISNLEWEDINWKTKEINFKGVKSVRPGGDNHTLPITPPIAQLLRKLKPKKRGAVFTYTRPAKDGKKPPAPQKINKLRRSWASARKKAGLDGLRFHDLRHTAATWLIQSGVDIGMVQEILAHRDIKTTRRYAHRRPAAYAEAMTKALDFGNLRLKNARIANNKKRKTG